MLQTATVHALAMEKVLAQIRHLSLSSRILQHTSRSNFTPLQSSSPTCEQNRCVGRYVSLFDPRVQLQIFQLLDFSSSPALTLAAGSPSIKAPSYVARIARSAFGQASWLTSNLTPFSPRIEKTFLATRASFDTFSSSTGSSC